jgi:hypothetical protein
MEGLNRKVNPIGNAPKSVVPALPADQAKVMNDALKEQWDGKWGKALIRRDSLKNPKIREKFIGGILNVCFSETRVPGQKNLKKDMNNWMLNEHNTTITEAEYAKYVKVFMTNDQAIIDQFLDDDQNRLNLAQPEKDRLEVAAENERERQRIIARHLLRDISEERQAED